MSQGSSFPVGKVLAGCGCVMVIVGAAVAAVLFGGSYFAYTKAKEAGVGELIKEVDEQVSAAKKNGVSSGSGADSKNNDTASKKDTKASTEQMLSWPSTPLTQKDVDAHLNFMKKWESSNSTQEMIKNRETLEDLSKDKDKGAIDNLRQLNAIKNMTMNSAKAYEEMEQLAKKYGGPDEVMRRYFQIIAVSGAASGVATKDDLNTLASDKTAKAMLAQHEKWSKEYEVWKKVNQEYYRVILSVQSDPELMKKLSKDPDFQKQTQERQKELNKVQKTKPGLLVLGKLPKKSLQTWDGLSEKTRQQILSKYSTIPFLPFFAFIPAQKYDAKDMAKQILALEYSRMIKEVTEQEAKEKTK